MLRGPRGRPWKEMANLFLFPFTFFLFTFMAIPRAFHRFVRFRWNRVPLFAVALLLGGCGLADYEKKMEEAQKRVEVFDKEGGALLAKEPLELASAGERGTIFFRPPWGIKAKGTANGPFLTYLREFNKQGGKFEDAFNNIKAVSVLVATDGNRDGFRKNIKEALADIQAVGKKSVARRGSAELPFEVWMDDSHAEESDVVYVYQSGQTLVALAFHLKKGKTEADSQEVIDASLRTLLIGEPAAKELQRFRPKES